ncbi:MAG: glycosyltransferase, partial [Aureliella sp.]
MLESPPLHFTPIAPTMSLRLALVIHALYGGGAERLMSQLASRWAEAGHSVDLITLAKVETDRYELDRRVVRHGLDLMQESRGPARGLLANLERVRRLRRELVAVKPDFILSFCDRMNIVTAAAAQRLGVPLWLAEHSDPRKQQLGPLWEAWRTRAYPRASGCVVLTEPIAAWMRKRFPKLPIEVIPPAITPPESLAETLPAGHDQSGEKRLLAIGRHSPEKNMQAV